MEQTVAKIQYSQGRMFSDKIFSFASTQNNALEDQNFKGQTRSVGYTSQSEHDITGSYQLFVVTYLKHYVFHLMLF